MDKIELKLRELQHEEVETSRKLQRLVLTKVSKTPFWAKIIIFVLCVNLVHTYFFTHGKEDYKSEEVAGSHRQTKRAFMKAAAYCNAGDIEAMNIALNEMAKTKGFQIEKWRQRNLRYAVSNLPEVFVDSFTSRFRLVETPGAIEAIDRMVKAQKSDSEG
jgi:hypothetical protein